MPVAAEDKFESFNAALSPKEKTQLGNLISLTWREILAARSEDARVRVVQDYIREAYDSLQRKR